MLAKYYNNSVAKALLSEYPNHTWHVWLFDKTPKGWWTTIGSKLKTADPESIATIRAYLKHLEPSLGIKKPIEWIQITNKQLGSTAEKRFYAMGGLRQVLATVYANEFASEGNLPKTNVRTLRTPRHATQGDLKKAIQG